MTWRRTPPTQAGAYWWWSGDPDTAPYLLEVMGPGTGNSFWVCRKYDGWARDVTDASWDGWWWSIPEPSTEDVVEFIEIKKHN